MGAVVTFLAYLEGANSILIKWWFPHIVFLASPSLASLTHRILGLPLRGMYNLGMISDKALQAVVMWLNGRYSAAAAALLLGRTPSPAAAPATTNPTNPDPGRPQGRPTRKHSRLYSPPSSPQANP